MCDLRPVSGLVFMSGRDVCLRLQSLILYDLRNVLCIQSAAPPSGNMSGGLDLFSVYRVKRGRWRRRRGATVIHVCDSGIFSPLIRLLISGPGCWNQPRLYALTPRLMCVDDCLKCDAFRVNLTNTKSRLEAGL